MSARVWAIASAAVVAVAIAAALFVIGSPAEQRREQLDARRVQDLRTLSYQVTAHWTQKQRLPESTAELVDGRALSRLPVDPVSKAAYEYGIASPRQFELCATFDRDSPPAERGDFWAHASGRKCFSFDVDDKVAR
jgi:hypothetical protein